MVVCKKPVNERKQCKPSKSITSWSPPYRSQIPYFSDLGTQGFRFHFFSGGGISYCDSDKTGWPTERSCSMNYVFAAMVNSETQTEEKKKRQRTTSQGKYGKIKLIKGLCKNIIVLWHRYGVLIFKTKM